MIKGLKQVKSVKNYIIYLKEIKMVNVFIQEFQKKYLKMKIQNTIEFVFPQILQNVLKQYMMKMNPHMSYMYMFL